jgi:hypothetical protein
MTIFTKSIARTLTVVALVSSLFGAAAHADAILTGNFAADNYAFVYLSTSATSRGTLIGQASGWSSASALSTTNLASGTYYLNIEVINADSGLYSQGGFLGDFSLGGDGTFATGSNHLLTSTTGWLAGYNDSNFAYTQQAWVAPTASAVSEGANGIAPWGNISGISGSANWIWSGDLQSGLNLGMPGTQCAACTIDFQAKLTVVPEPASWTVMLIGLAGLAAMRGRRMRAAARA